MATQASCAETGAEEKLDFGGGEENLLAHLPDLTATLTPSLIFSPSLANLWVALLEQSPKEGRTSPIAAFRSLDSTGYIVGAQRMFQG